MLAFSYERPDHPDEPDACGTAVKETQKLKQFRFRGPKAVVNSTFDLPFIPSVAARHLAVVFLACGAW
jgi:hypothetical protein